MRYQKQVIYIIFILCGILGGCTAEDGTDSANGTDNSRLPLTICATASGFDGLTTARKPSTRTPVEDGTTTTFTTGDAIGIFTIKDGKIADGISNAKLTYSEDASGTAGCWNPQEGTTLYWYEGVSYVAYYPYKDGITIDASKTTDEIIASLADNGSLQPATDQSDTSGSLANYTACDLMTASGTPEADSGNPARKILALNFEHQFALLVLDPQVYMACTAPANGGFVYRTNSKAPVTDSNVKSATINGVTACRMSDGTYRALVKPTAGASQITGSYLTRTDNKKVSFNGSSIAAGLAAGHYYKVEVIRSTPNTTDSWERALAPGDFVFHGSTNIEIYPGDGPLTSGKIPDYNSAVGIVATCNQSRLTDDVCSAKGWSHAYVMGLETYGSRLDWGVNNVDESVLPNMETVEYAEKDMNGYAETEAMLAERASKGDLSSYGVFNAINTYRSSHAVPAGLSRSPWFVPSVGQWFDVLANLCGRSPKTFSGILINSWSQSNCPELWNTINSRLNKVGKPLSMVSAGQAFFWSSSEGNAKYPWCLKWTSTSQIYLSTSGSKSATVYQYVIRPFFAF